MAKRWLPRKVWHGVHLFSYVAAWMMAVHAVTTGTDLKEPVVAWGSLALVAVTTLVTLRKVVGIGAERSPATLLPWPPVRRRWHPRAAERTRSWPGGSAE